MCGDLDGSAPRALGPSLLRRRAESVAVIGCGYWGLNHARVLSQIGDIGVIPVDAQPGVAETVAKRFRLPAHATRLSDCLDEVDAVVIATPPSSHYELGLLALRAGKHVLMEKPLARSVSECDDLLAAATDSGVQLAVGHTFLFSAGVEALAATAAHPSFGAPVHVASERLSLGLYRPDVNVLWDLAPHDISIINHVLGSEPTSVSCWAASRRSVNHDIATLALDYGELDATATVHVSWLHPEKVRRVTVIGENRMAELDETQDRPLRIYDTSVCVAEDQQSASYHQGDISLPVLDKGEPLFRQTMNFLDACNRVEELRSSGESGRSVVAVIEAAHMSMELGRPVRLAEVIGERLDLPRSGSGTIILSRPAAADATVAVLQA